MDYDRAYANGPFIPGAESFPPRWTREAAEFREALGQRALTAIPYGPKPRNHLDLFLPEGVPQGLLMFIHGGYWLKYDREMWSHLAAGAVPLHVGDPLEVLVLEDAPLEPRARVGQGAELTVALRSGPVLPGVILVRLAEGDVERQIAEPLVLPLDEGAKLVGARRPLGPFVLVEAREGDAESALLERADRRIVDLIEPAEPRQDRKSVV